MRYYRKLDLFLLVFLLGFGLNQLIPHSQAQGDHDSHTQINECDTPSETVIISSHTAEIRYDKTELFVPKKTCFLLVYKNLGEIEHDFTLEREDGSEWASIHLDNALDNSTGPTPGLREVNLFTPDIDRTYDFYCSVPGHRAAGEQGELIVGEGTVEVVVQSSTDEHSESDDQSNSTIAESSSTGDVQVSFMKYYTAIFSFILFSSINIKNRKKSQ